MLLQNLNIIGRLGTADIRIRKDKITDISAAAGMPAEPLSLTFEDAIALPGLINSHEHLDFNLFPHAWQPGLP